jgi:hypothetical protein
MELINLKLALSLPAEAAPWLIAAVERSSAAVCVRMGLINLKSALLLPAEAAPWLKLCKITKHTAQSSFVMS